MKKRIVVNMGSTLLLEIVTLVCAFVLPRLIMTSFGSEYNGIVSSVSQFLSFITILRGGIGGVTKAALYEPLIKKDVKRISGIVKATEIFMRKIAWCFLMFLILFASVYPMLIKNQFGWFYIFTLVLILGLSTISQYFFGITYQFLTQADQRQYVYNILQIVATIINTVVCVILIRAGVDFRIVKLAAAIVFGSIPVALYYYVRRKYIIIKSVKPDNSAIVQRWDAFAHQVAAFVNANTDIVLITVFSDLYQVAIYSIYFMIMNGVNKFVRVCSSGIESVIGQLIAKKDSRKLEIGMDLYEWLINVVSTVFFTCTAILIVPFVMVYTRGVTDTDYYQPLLGYLMCISQFLACVRLPYQNAVEGAGHFKKTRNGAILEAILNIIITIPMILMLGCAGAVIGTIVSTAMRTVQYAAYVSKNILHRPFYFYLKRMTVSAMCIAFVIVPYYFLQINIMLESIKDYGQWIVYAVSCFVIVCLFTMFINYVCYRQTSRLFFCFVLGKRKN